MTTFGIGEMTERLSLQRSDPVPTALSSVTRSGTTATATTAAAHGYASGDLVTIAGATPVGYNGKVQIVVTGPTTFTFSVEGSLATPAIGTITAVYASDPQRGRRITWTTLDTVWAERVPLRASESLQLAALQPLEVSRFRIHARADVTPGMRALWTPNWPPGSATRTLDIASVQPGREPEWQYLECTEAPAV